MLGQQKRLFSQSGPMNHIARRVLGRATTLRSLQRNNDLSLHFGVGSATTAMSGRAGEVRDETISLSIDKLRSLGVIRLKEARYMQGIDEANHSYTSSLR